MRRPAFLLMVLLLESTIAFANAGSLAEELRAVGLEPPTFDEVHEQFFGLVWNEAGANSLPDADGILRTLTSRRSPRVPGLRDENGKLDMGDPEVRAKFLIRAINHSPRTFAIDSPWRATYRSPKRLRFLDRLRTPRNSVTNAITLDCAKPLTWDKAYPGLEWSIEKCFAMVDATRKLLKDEIRSRCDDDPHTWGSEVDVEKRREKMKGWIEVTCDRPRARVPGNTLSCPDLRADRTKGWRTRLANSTECARNRFWSWKSVRWGRAKVE